MYFEIINHLKFYASRINLMPPNMLVVLCTTLINLLKQPHNARLPQNCFLCPCNLWIGKVLNVNKLQHGNEHTNRLNRTILKIIHSTSMYIVDVCTHIVFPRLILHPWLVLQCSTTYLSTNNIELSVYFNNSAPLNNTTCQYV